MRNQINVENENIRFRQVWVTHDTYDEGGRKTHIYHPDELEDKTLCGVDLDDKLADCGDFRECRVKDLRLYVDCKDAVVRHVNNIKI